MMSSTERKPLLMGAGQVVGVYNERMIVLCSLGAEETNGPEISFGVYSDYKFFFIESNKIRGIKLR